MLGPSRRHLLAGLSGAVAGEAQEHLVEGGPAQPYVLGRYTRAVQRLHHPGKRRHPLPGGRADPSGVPVYLRVSGAERYPTAARVEAAAGAAYEAAYDPDYAFEFGLARVLDGIVG